MENYKIIIPIENEDEEKMLREVAGSVDGIEITSGDTRNLSGAILADIYGQAQELIEFAGALITIYAFFSGRRVRIVDKDNNVKNNVKMKDLSTFIKNLMK